MNTEIMNTLLTMFHHQMHGAINIDGKKNRYLNLHQNATHLQLLAWLPTEYTTLGDNQLSAMSINWLIIAQSIMNWMW